MKSHSTWRVLWRRERWIKDGCNVCKNISVNLTLWEPWRRIYRWRREEAWNLVFNYIGSLVESACLAFSFSGISCDYSAYNGAESIFIHRCRSLPSNKWEKWPKSPCQWQWKICSVGSASSTTAPSTARTNLSAKKSTTSLRPTTSSPRKNKPQKQPLSAYSTTISWLRALFPREGEEPARQNAIDISPQPRGNSCRRDVALYWILLLRQSSKWEYTCTLIPPANCGSSLPIKESPAIWPFSSLSKITIWEADYRGNYNQVKLKHCCESTARKEWKEKRRLFEKAEKRNKK